MRRGVGVAIGVAIALVLYVSGVYLAAPRLVDGALARFSSEPGREASVAGVRVRPFSWQLELEDARFEIDELGIDVARITAQLSPRSLIEGRPVWRAVTLVAPSLAGALRSARNESAGEANADPSWPFARHRIERLELTDGELMLTFGAAPNVRRVSLVEVGARVLGLDARASPAGRGAVLARGDAGIEVALDAELAEGFAGVTGTFTMTGLSLDALGSLDARIAALEPSGALDLRGNYRVDAVDGLTSLGIEAGRAALSDFSFTVAPDVGLRGTRSELDVAAWLDPRAARALTRATLEARDQAFELVDARWPGPVTWDLTGATGAFTIDAAGDTALELETRLVEGGFASLTATPQGFELDAEELQSEQVSPYARAVLERGLTAGRLDLSLEHRVEGTRRGGALGVTATGLALEDDGGERDAELALAQALLETADGTLSLAVPLAPGPLGASVVTALRDRITGLTTAPFEVLGTLVARRAGALDRVTFAPGAAAPSEATIDSLAVLADALGARPKLAVRVPARFHPEADRDALAAQQIELHVLLATAGPTFRARPEPIDFSSPRAHDVLDEFAAERLPAARLEAIAARFSAARDADAPVEQRAGYYRALFDALVANETIEPQALTRLGRFRAQAVADTLAELGVMRERVIVGSVAPLPPASRIELELELEALMRTSASP